MATAAAPGAVVVAFPSSEIHPVHVLDLASCSVERLAPVAELDLVYPAAASDPSYSVQNLVVAASQSSVDLELPSDVESRVEERRIQVVGLSFQEEEKVLKHPY